MRYKLIVIVSLFLSGCLTTPHKDIDIEASEFQKLNSGDVVRQRSEKLGHGFYEVKRSTINASDHWEGIGHFSFIYFGKSKICQCSAIDTVISPNGKFIVYHSGSRKRLELYNSQSKEITAISEKYIGYPRNGDWMLKTNKVVVDLDNLTDTVRNQIEIPLN